MSRLRVLVALALLSACGGSPAPPRTKVVPLREAAVPAEVAGLRVTPEDAAKALKNARPSYAEAVGLYGLRSGELLQATLQVARLREGNRYRTDAFRRSVVSRLGASAPRSFRLDDVTVWFTTGTKQRVAVWFRDRHMYVLSVREEFVRWRDLVRSSLGIRA